MSTLKYKGKGWVVARAMEVNFTSLIFSLFLDIDQIFKQLFFVITHTLARVDACERGSSVSANYTACIELYILFLHYL